MLPEASEALTTSRPSMKHSTISFSNFQLIQGWKVGSYPLAASLCIGLAGCATEGPALACTPNAPATTPFLGLTRCLHPFLIHQCASSLELNSNGADPAHSALRSACCTLTSAGSRHTCISGTETSTN